MKFIAIFTSLVLCICMICSFVTLENDNIYKDTVRLHIIAESDSAPDRMLKLSLRDKMTDYLSALAENAESADEVVCIIGENVDQIRKFADDALASLGSDAKTEVVLSNEYYPSKNTENIRLPAGTYTSLRIKIGKAEGHNWWCVLYPQLSKGAATVDDALIKTGFSSEQIELLTGNDRIKYKLRFKILEIFG
ncbi:MAG: stage II sporulation protein R [Eubacteriales bacterium]|nr:stage II sporulation protein R [Eubacteriales bacterium]